MSRGLLSEHFEGVCAKKLSAVEADSGRSNQHEFNGTNALKKLLTEKEPLTFAARFLYLDDEIEPLEAIDDLTWYDARRAHPTRSEYRLYYPSNAVSEAATEGDTLILARQRDGQMLCLVAKDGSTIERQLIWLFALPDNMGKQFCFEELIETERSDFATRFILDELGIEIEAEQNDLDLILARFGMRFPKTREFSSFARENAPKLGDFDNVDQALIAWMDREESLFRQLEKHIVAERLRKGFVDGNNVDVDGFVAFSLSVQNRRKARVGYAFENHLEQIFIDLKIPYSRGAITERREKPDFIFPSIEQYRRPEFPNEKLFMLGVKSTCKDRWRQVLTEAERIEEKHLITLEPGISEHQTHQMQAANLQLVVPTSIQQSYLPLQRDWLFSVSDFLSLLSSSDGEGISHGKNKTLKLL
ncbi:MAG: restriction endonuclease [Oceanospirillaceae bacterium]|nr:restriction endonuclease [Oceanospirillaceae bacterium]